MKKPQKKIPAKKPSKIFYIIAASIPFVFVILLEIILRIAGYGIDTEQWKRMGDKYIINPEIAYKYFNSVENIPTTIEDAFDVYKKDNAFRVFVLGGSSAAGFPYEPMGSFSRYIRRRLELSYPDKKIEVVNISMSAVNSYTVLDLLSGVLEQKPNAVIIYAGHNEYYGALGVGSMESLGQSRSIVKLMLYLNDFKTVQLLRNIIKSIFSSVSSEGKMRSGTLMSQMVGDKEILYETEKFKAGINQFTANLDEICELCRNANVPLFLGKLTCNLKDQRPFISKETDNFPAANSIFKEATENYKNGDYQKADSLYRFARDLDGLRFRAPDEINEVLIATAKKYNIPLANIDSAFCVNSEHRLVGMSLMTDHLHPNLKGYKLMGKVFFDKMKEKKYLPAETGNDKIVPDSLACAEFVISDLDTMIANYRVVSLKNDWPFINPINKKQLNQIIKPQNIIDSMAFDVLSVKSIWLDAHIAAAKKYKVKKDYKNFADHYRIIIYQYPFIYEFRDEVINVLLKQNMFNEAKPFLEDYYSYKPTAFNSKWLGNVELFNKNYPAAIGYLKKSIELKGDDAQVHYNLAGAYAIIKNYREGLKEISRCLELQKDYPGASQLKMKLEIAAAK